MIITLAHSKLPKLKESKITTSLDVNFFYQEVVINFLKHFLGFYFVDVENFLQQFFGLDHIGFDHDSGRLVNLISTK